MAKKLNDPLLALGRGVTWVLIVAVGLIAVLFAICLPLTLIMPETVFSALLEKDVVTLPPGAAGYLTALLAVAVATLLAMAYYLKQQLDVIGSVAEGDPFVPANADRLARMGWSVLGIQALAVPLGLLEFARIPPAGHIRPRRHDRHDLVRRQRADPRARPVHPRPRVPPRRRYARRPGRDRVMPVTVKLDDLLHARRMTLTELSERIDLTLANLSILKTGKAKAIRFSTLEAICRELDCQPGDVLGYED
jgi:putative transcriptional regulator